MKINKDIMNILSRWEYVSDNDIVKVKRTLMPDDDHQTISIIVTAHPNIKEDGSIYIEWCDISVYQNKEHLCHIIVDSHTMTATYSF